MASRPDVRRLQGVCCGGRAQNLEVQVIEALLSRDLAGTADESALDIGVVGENRAVGAEDPGRQVGLAGARHAKQRQYTCDAAVTLGNEKACLHAVAVLGDALPGA